MSNSIVSKLVVDSESLTEEKVSSLFKKMDLFVPSEMMGTNITKGKKKKFSETTFYLGILREIASHKPFTLGVEDGANWLTVKKSNIHTFVTINLTGELFNQNKDRIFRFIEDAFSELSGIVAFACSSEDDFWQNNTDPDFYRLRNKSIEGVRLKQCPIIKGRQIVDIEYNPGHSHFIGDVWFGSCWAMWFGKGFFRYIPNQMLSDYNNCFENKTLASDSIRILLYEDVFDYGNLQSRDKQWFFRKNVGIDEIAHSLMKEPIKQQDPTVEIETLEKLPNGKGMKVTYYYGKSGELVPKSKATTFKSYELDVSGNTISYVESKSGGQ
ncbi:hypothetical protein [Paenibacillus sp. MBLB4367]|uniref:hypothetical protein n=1 Tax=Paenibacillus sp. MBLB4367 TaxID=3384767 RepID=UPI003907F7BD